jgi:hypothetical protein
MDFLAGIVVLVLLLFAIRIVGKRSESRASFVEAEPEQTDMLHTTHLISTGRPMEIAVHGEAQRNSDGTSRQDIIARLKEGEYVSLIREPENQYDRNAVRVDSTLGTIGYIPASQCAAIGALLKASSPRKCYIDKIAGSDDRFSNLGVWLKIEF